MPFSSFHDLFPEVAERETRTISVRGPLRLSPPAGDYGFVEMFCDETGCDCRRVMFSVVSSVTKEVEAVIALGWEELSFYAKWLKLDDPEIVRDLKGPVLNFGSPQGRHAAAILELAKQHLLTDATYVERVQRHYRMFRDEIERRGEASAGRHAKRSRRESGRKTTNRPRPTRPGKKRRPSRGE